MIHHGFSLDPYIVLGVGPGASSDQIQAAYRAKSKKHHPDAGGDEWAFRLVVRAYELLAAKTDTHSAVRSDVRSAGEAEQTKQGSEAAPLEMRTLTVELMWTRHDRDEVTGRPASPEADGATISVCIVISWPTLEFVDRAPEFTSAGDTLRTLIEGFEQLRAGKSVVGARSRIEDGRFVAWLSFPDVFTAWDAYHVLSERLQKQGFVIKLHVRDVLLAPPVFWSNSGEEATKS